MFRAADYLPAMAVAKRAFSGLAGGFALSVMMIPIVMRASEEALKLVPQALRNASHALGASQWQTVVRVTVPAALPAIITAVFLAIARVAGETAPLLMTASSNDYMAAVAQRLHAALCRSIFSITRLAAYETGTDRPGRRPLCCSWSSWYSTSASGS